jgi:hypothetical protein
MSGVRSAIPLAGAVLALVCGCSQTEQQPAAGSSGPQTVVTVYFLTDGGLAPLSVRRSVARGSPFARRALGALLSGPNDAERRAGITSAIPRQAVVRSFSIAPSVSRASGTATVDLGGMPSVERAGAVNIARVGTQVARTLIGVSGIERVRLRANGKPWGFWSMQAPHRVIDRPWDYDALLGLNGICDAKPGTEAVPGDCFSALP